MRIFVCFMLALFSSLANAEIYHGIEPFFSLGEVKSLFPTATVKKLEPAWAQPEDALYQFTGKGINGSIVVYFMDFRPKFKKDLEQNTDPENFAVLQKLSQESDEDSLTVFSVRWVPDDVIPVQRLITKYGKDSKTAFDGEYRPYREWESKGVTANLSDDEKFVRSIEYSFTKSEKRQAHLKKYNFIPEHLKEDENKPKTKKSK